MFFALLFIIVILIGVQRYWTLNKLVNENSEVFTESQILIDVCDELEDLKDNYEKYISSMTKSNSEQYYESINSLNNVQKKLSVNKKKGSYKLYNDKTIKLISTIDYYFVFSIKKFK